MALPSTLTSQELAGLHGITIQALGALEARGIIKKLRRNEYPLSASAALSSHYREQAAGRQGSETKYDVVAERARLAKEQADGQEIKNAVARGQLVEAEAVARRWDTQMAMIRACMLGLPSDIAQLLPHMTRHDTDTIDRAVRDALTQAADELDNAE